RERAGGGRGDDHRRLPAGRRRNGRGRPRIRRCRRARRPLGRRFDTAGRPASLCVVVAPAGTHGGDATKPVPVLLVVVRERVGDRQRHGGLVGPVGVRRHAGRAVRVAVAAFVLALRVAGDVVAAHDGGFLPVRRWGPGRAGQ